MSIKFIEGFDSYGSVAEMSHRWEVSNSGTGLSLVAGRSGYTNHQAIRFAASQITTRLFHAIGIDGDNDSEMVFGFAFRFSVLPVSVSTILELGRDNGSGAVDHDTGNLAIDSSGNLLWRRDTTTVQTGSAGLSVDVWYYIEVRVEIQDTSSAGDLQVWVDGALDINATSQRTITADPITYMSFGASAAIGTLDFDDFYILDPLDGVSPTAALGDVTVSTLIPDGDGNTAAWTRVSGTNDWEMVDDGLATDPDGDTTYVSSSTAGEQSLFTLTALDSELSGEAVHVVAVNYVSMKDAAGGPGFYPVIRTNSVDLVGTDDPMNSGQGVYTYAQKLYPTDAEAGSWAYASVNAMEAGMEVEVA